MNADYALFNRRHFLKHLAGLSALALPGMQFVQSLRAAAPVFFSSPSVPGRVIPWSSAP